MKKISLVFILIIAFLITIFGVVQFLKVKSEARKKVFVPAPDFTLLNAQGEEKSLSDFKGKVVILNFWAIWCPPCKIEIPHLVDLYEEYKDDGLEIIGISMDWNAQRIVGPFAEENGMEYTVLLGDNEIADLYGGILTIPVTFVIDRDGGITKRYLGYRDKETLESAIKRLF